MAVWVFACYRSSWDGDASGRQPKFTLIRGPSCTTNVPGHGYSQSFGHLSQVFHALQQPLQVATPTRIHTLVHPCPARLLPIAAEFQ